MSKAKRIKITFAILMILSGAGVFSYPFIGNYLANRNATVAVTEYNKQVDSLEKEEIDALKEAISQRNQLLGSLTEQYESVEAESETESGSYLDLVKIGSAIGYISIPRIDIELPIYEGTTDYILEHGIGHIIQTSYPIGGKGTHSVLTGHRGLANAELFTNLDKLEKGHHFYLHVLDEVLAYEVDQIKIVLPDEIEDLEQIKDEDLCTLVTCTPLGINSHRMLVRGHRVEYTGEEDDSKTLYQSVHTGTAMQRLVQIWPWLTLAAMLIMGAELMLCIAILRHMRERMEED